MIGDALRVEIEKYAATMKRSNPLYTKAADGTMSKACIGAYLANVQYLLCQTPVHLSRARTLAIQQSDVPLAKHFDHKLDEEQGHDAWAARDYERVKRTSGIVPKREATLGMRQLVGHVASIIEEDPALYLAYIMFAEYLIVLLGPEWLDLLEQRCGIPKTSMTVIGNHIELDKHHVDEALDEIDALVGDPTKLPRMRAVLRDTFAIFDRFCAEVTSVPQHERLRNVAAVSVA